MPTQVLISPDRTKIVTVAAGPAGIQGPPGGSVSLIAGMALSGHRVITTNPAGDAIYADNATPAHAQATIGVSTASALIGGSINVVLHGFVDHTWGFAPGAQLWLNGSGVVTDVPPSGPGLFSRSIGYAVTATRIFVAPQPPIDLA